jgi:adenylate cyclase
MTPRPAQSRKPIPKFIAAGVLSVVVFGLVMLTRMPGRVQVFVKDRDYGFYDYFYTLRHLEDQSQGPIVIVTADQESLTKVDKGFKDGWPWPREFWGDIATYVAKAGAKEIVFDLLLSEASTYNNKSPDDDTFADAINSIQCPVVFASNVKDGKFGPFAPAVKHPHLGASNVHPFRDDRCRYYLPTVDSHESLAAAALTATGVTPKLTSPFELHYFGPDARGKSPFRYVPACNVLSTFMHELGLTTGDFGVTPDMFKGKIVILTSTAEGTFDVKATPLSDRFPGAEIQATAIVNMLTYQQVVEVPTLWRTLICFLCCIFAGFGVIYPRTAKIKLTIPMLTAALLFGIGILLFRKANIYWLAPAESFMALLLVTPTGFAYTYFVEDRQSRFMLEALSKVISPTVANQLSKNPVTLQRDTEKRLLTVLFTDLANFTSLSESMGDDNRKLVELLDDYLDAMSNEVIKENGTLDKYIGDSVMCFWNAPLEQADHAVRACRTALAMQALKKEYSITIQGKEMKIYTRIGINTTLAGFGFVGSRHLMNYTVLGDGVNLASRLEGGNKLYGSRILISQATAELVKSEFHLRRLDSLVVKGKTKPIDVFELLTERGKADPAVLEKAKLYESALDAYQHRQWQLAHDQFIDLCARFGEDHSSRTLLKRIAAYRVKEPPPEWSGAYDAEDK